jgi:hypothetical protein
MLEANPAGRKLGPELGDEGERRLCCLRRRSSRVERPVGCPGRLLGELAHRQFAVSTARAVEAVHDRPVAPGGVGIVDRRLTV